MKLLKKILKAINDFNQKQWLLVSIITTTIGIWFPFIVGFLGEKLHLIYIDDSGNKQFTILGIFLTLMSIIWSLLSSLSQRYYDYRVGRLGITEENIDNTENVYCTLNFSNASIVEKGVSAKLKCIDKLYTKSINMVNYPVKKPCETLTFIISEITSTLSKLLTSKSYNVREHDLNVNIYYRFPLDQDVSWHRAHNIKQEKGLKIEELLSPNSTFFQAMNSTQKYAFYNDKHEAYLNNRYIPDSEDIRIKGKIEGSIACFIYSLSENGNKYIEFMVTIATYGKKFSKKNSEDENQNIAYNLKKNVFAEYEMLIKSALADLYITHLLAQQTSQAETE